ncbi:transposase [Glycomyces paridis]|uniref:Transposase n=1 Tax=Glycomyces paridis TaxID=2126555 RepID=A0A4S8P9W6_9ACTN|nr:transposase [Glycomyces paridis]
MGEAPPGRARPTRRRRRDRLVEGDHRRREPAREEGGSLTGPNPVDRGKSGSKIHVLTDQNGLPLALGVSAANLHDSQAFEPLIQGIPKIRSRRDSRRRKPAKVHADKAYDIPDCHTALRERGIGDRIARGGIAKVRAHRERHRATS